MPSAGRLGSLDAPATRGAAPAWPGAGAPWRVIPRRLGSGAGSSQLVLVRVQVPPGGGWIRVRVLPEQV